MYIHKHEIFEKKKERTIIMNTERKVYIYNPLQAQFYMNNGSVCLNTGIHKRTHKTFWVFGFEDTEEIYVQWIKREH